MTKAAYEVFRQSAQTVVKKAELEGRHSASEMRVLRHTLNDFTQSVFMQVRSHLLLPGVEEPIDESLAAAAEAAQQAYKEARVALQVEMDAVEAIIGQTVKQPLADVVLDSSSAVAEAAVSTPAAPSTTMMKRLAEKESRTRAAIDKLASELPAALESAAQHAEYLSRASAAQPLSSEVREVLTRVNADLAAAAAGGNRPTRAAKKEQQKRDTPASAGKTPKSPARRLSARLSAKPY